MIPKRRSWLLITVDAAGWIPLLVISALYLTNHLTADPIRRSMQSTGDVAITFLILTLACTPFNTITRLSQVLVLKRPLGLFTFLYAGVHFLLFIGLDYGFNLTYIMDVIKGNWFIWLGLSALVILLLLAILTFTCRTGKSQGIWKALNRLIYIAGILAALHFGLALKGNLFKLQGDFIRPLIVTLTIALLLLLRLPFIEKAISSLHRSSR